MNSYRGRFAPSPTGPLHFGSLFAAVISYMDARYHKGEWFLRIEDIDPPREFPNASQLIIDTLQAHGLAWDSDITFQSKRSDLYLAALKNLVTAKKCYECPCSRKQLIENHGKHLRYCVESKTTGLECAQKFKAEGQNFAWVDGIQGNKSSIIQDDFVLIRKEGLFSYQLAVVVDDIEQEITHVTRGYDLLDSTPPQLAIYKALGKTPPVFSHFPVIENKLEQKLSKQNMAPPVDNNAAIDNLLNIFQLLGINFSSPPQSPSQVLSLAFKKWSPTKIPKTASIQIE